MPGARSVNYTALKHGLWGTMEPYCSKQYLNDIEIREKAIICYTDLVQSINLRLSCAMILMS